MKRRLSEERGRSLEKRDRSLEKRDRSLEKRDRSFEKRDRSFEKRGEDPGGRLINKDVSITPENTGVKALLVGPLERSADFLFIYFFWFDWEW